MTKTLTTRDDWTFKIARGKKGKYRWQLYAANITSGQFNMSRMPSQLVENFNKMVVKVHTLEQKVQKLERMSK